MVGDAEIVLAGHDRPQAKHVVACKFNQFLTPGAIQVVMLGVAVIVLIDRATIKLKRPQQARVNKFLERSIHRRTADIVGFALAWQLIDQGIDIKMLMIAENLLNQKTSLFRVALPSGLKKFVETLLGRQRNRYFF